MYALERYLAEAKGLKKDPVLPVSNYLDKLDIRAIKEGIAEIESYGTDRENPYTVLNQSGSSAQGKYQFTDWWMTKGNMPYSKFASLTKDKGENKKEFLARVKEHFISHPKLQEKYMDKIIKEDYAPKVNNRAYKDITEKYGAANTIAMLHYNGAPDTKRYNKLVKQGKEGDFKAEGQDEGLNVSTAKYQKTFKKGVDDWYKDYDKQIQLDYVKNKLTPQSSGNILEQKPAQYPTIFLDKFNVTPTTQDEYIEPELETTPIEENEISSNITLDSFKQGGKIKKGWIDDVPEEEKSPFLSTKEWHAKQETNPQMNSQIYPDWFKYGELPSRAKSKKFNPYIYHTEEIKKTKDEEGEEDGNELGLDITGIGAKYNIPLNKKLTFSPQASLTNVGIKYNNTPVGNKLKPSFKASLKYNFENGGDISQMGYRDDSPYRNRESIEIDTPTGQIDMSNTGIPLMANGRYLAPYSGMHQFNTNKVTETPVKRNGGWLDTY